MKRLFGEHNIRHGVSLDGAWLAEKCAWDNGAEGAMSSPITVVVPCVHDNLPGFESYEGAVRYERDFYFEGGCLLLHFGAVMTECRVYLDGELLGEHYGGFNEFELVKSGVAAGDHRLTVIVNNAFDECSIPQKDVDWYHHGGIIRSVTCQRLEGVAVRLCNMHYELDPSLKSARAYFECELTNATERCLTDTLKIEVEGICSVSVPVTLEAGQTVALGTDTVTLEGFELWSPERPALYKLTASTSADDLIDRVGFRRIEVSGKDILLNRKKYTVRGVNRHEDHPDFGFAFPEGLMRRDIDIITQMGANSIRGSHYPNSRPFLDMLDTMGITFWSEIPIWGCGFSVETLGNETVRARGEKMLEEMVRCYYNHPSIILWGMHNEIHSYTDEAYEMTRRFRAVVDRMDSSRPIVYATACPTKDTCYEFCDIVCINNYTGWYGGNMEEWPNKIVAFKDHMKQTGADNKPLIMSEFGAASVWGHHDFDTRRWSENYQARLISYCLELFFADEDISGCYIWQFCDTKTSMEMGLNRARAYNNKGILNEHRKPKLAYFKVAEIYNRLKSEGR